MQTIEHISEMAVIREEKKNDQTLFRKYSQIWLDEWRFRGIDQWMWG